MVDYVGANAVLGRRCRCVRMPEQRCTFHRTRWKVKLSINISILWLGVFLFTWRWGYASAIEVYGYRPCFCQIASMGSCELLITGFECKWCASLEDSGRSRHAIPRGTRLPGGKYISIIIAEHRDGCTRCLITEDKDQSKEGWKIVVPPLWPQLLIFFLAYSTRHHLRDSYIQLLLKQVLFKMLLFMKILFKKMIT